MASAIYADVSWERMSNAVENVRRRLLRAASALARAKVPYAVAGGNAVAAWVSRVDETAVRNTQDVDIVLRRDDLPDARLALEQDGFVYRNERAGRPCHYSRLPLEKAGFVYRHAAILDMFLDGPNAKARDAVHIVFAAEKVRADYALPAPDVTESEETETFRLLSLEALVRMKLTSFRDKDRVHLRDLIDAGLLSESWLEPLASPLRARLQELLDTPEG